MVETPFTPEGAEVRRLALGVLETMQGAMAGLSDPVATSVFLHVIPGLVAGLVQAAPAPNREAVLECIVRTVRQHMANLDADAARPRH